MADRKLAIRVSVPALRRGAEDFIDSPLSYPPNEDTSVHAGRTEESKKRPDILEPQDLIMMPAVNGVGPCGVARLREKVGPFAGNLFLNRHRGVTNGALGAPSGR